MMEFIPRLKMVHGTKLHVKCPIISCRKNFQLGILHGIKSVAAELAKYFPRKYDDTNELPNDVRVR